VPFAGRNNNVKYKTVKCRAIIGTFEQPRDPVGGFEFTAAERDAVLGIGVGEKGNEKKKKITITPNIVGQTFRVLTYVSLKNTPAQVRKTKENKNARIRYIVGGVPKRA